MIACTRCKMSKPADEFYLRCAGAEGSPCDPLERSTADSDGETARERLHPVSPVEGTEITPLPVSVG